MECSISKCNADSKHYNPELPAWFFIKDLKSSLADKV